MSKWYAGGDGLECTCGELSTVVETPQGLKALCFDHTAEEGRIFDLPEEA